jgi:four helix bundle protein
VKENVIMVKSYEFALDVIKVSRNLSSLRKEFVISKQFIRSGTAIGALVKESEHAESRADFIHKLSIALKEANETEYWIYLLCDSGLITTDVSNSLKSKIKEILKILIAIIRSSKRIS